MANTTFYNRGDAYHDSAGNPAIIKKGNELTFTEHFNAGGGDELAPATAETLGGVKVGNGLNVASDGTLSAYIINMTSNTDYLTNKVLNSKPVYMRYIDLESAIGNRDVLSDVGSILSINLRIVDATREIILPNYNLQYETSFSWRLNTENHKIEYFTSDNATTYALRGYVEYTKPTPAETTTNNTHTVKKSTSKKG